MLLSKRTESVKAIDNGAYTRSLGVSSDKLAG